MATTVSDYTALLSGTYWYPGGAIARPVVLTYSFASALPSYGQDSGAADSSFSPLAASEQAAVRAALAAWSAVAGVTFLEVTGASGDLVFANFPLSGSEAGLGNFPDAGVGLDANGRPQLYASLQQLSGDIYFDTAVAGYSAANALHVALHEIGHALGLKHPFDGDVTLAAALDNTTHTVMSYNGYSPALGDLDIAAAQAIYGKPGATAAGEAWSWNAATQTFTESSTLSNDVVRGVGAPLNLLTAAADSTVVGGPYANVIHGGTNTSMSGGAGDDVFYSAGGGKFTVLGYGGNDIAVVATARPTTAFGHTAYGGTGLQDFYVYTGAVNGVSQFQDYVGVAYVEYADGLFSTAKNKYVDDGGFVALRNAYAAVLRAGGDDGSHMAVAQLADRVDAGALTSAAAMQAVVQMAIGTSEVAVLDYQFFTGKTPSAAGMDYLVAANGPNPNSLNSAYYAQFSTTNRYINFASNLGKVGEGAAAFQVNYGALSLTDATSKAYAAIFGTTPTADKVSHLLHDMVPNGLGGAYEREDYFAAYGLDGLNGQGTKAAMVGWLLAQGAQGDLGAFAKSDDAFLTDVANGQASFGVDLIGAYGKPAYAYSGG